MAADAQATEGAALEQRIWAVAERLGARHKLPADAVAALLARVIELIDEPRPDVERDQLPWSEARPHLQQLARLIGKVQTVLDERTTRDALLLHGMAAVDESVVARAVLLGRWAGGLEQLAGAAVRALEEGDRRNRRSRRRRPAWHREAAKLARAFWVEQKGKKGEKATCDFDGRGIEPRNPFSCFFCDLMRDVADVEPNECARALNFRGWAPRRR